MKTMAIVGMPRCGSTIVCSFFNSLPMSSIWGEVHRMRSSKTLESRYGNVNVWEDGSDENQLNNIKRFAKQNDLSLYGFKEVWDNSRNKFDPIQLVRAYEDELDFILVMIRDPRRQFGSIVALGHDKDISLKQFAEKYLEFCSLTEQGDKYIPFVLDMFLADPVKYSKKMTGLDMPDKVVLEIFTGGGDANARSAKEIRRRDARPTYSAVGLEKTISAYRKIISKQWGKRV